MVGVFVTFHYDDGVDADKVTHIADGVAPSIRFVQIADLVDNAH